MITTISVLVPVRPNSSLLSRFLSDYFDKTKDQENTELLLMIHPKDRNKSMVESNKGIRVVLEKDENTRLGQRGHHIYINELAKYAKGDWMLCLGEDCNFLMGGWDDFLRYTINKLFVFGGVAGLDPKRFFVIMPPFDPPGAVEPMFSRGCFNALDGRLVAYPNTDSWMNTVMSRVGTGHGRMIIMAEKPALFSSDRYDTSSGEKLGVPVVSEKITLPYGEWGSQTLEEEINKEAAKIAKFLREWY